MPVEGLLRPDNFADDDEEATDASNEAMNVRFFRPCCCLKDEETELFATASKLS